MEYLSEFASDFASGFGPIDSDVIGGFGFWAFVIWLITRKYKEPKEPKEPNLKTERSMNAKTIGMILVAVVVAYFIMSPYQNCMRSNSFSNSATSLRCQTVTSW
mgnify:CR=1 FL=1|tara:strand:+ start:348 stop:659 length:312 start_codon:yes stop_codon:yes gene_type:complete